MKKFVGWRYAALIGGFVTAVCAAMYPIAIDPALNPDKWSKFQQSSPIHKN